MLIKGPTNWKLSDVQNCWQFLKKCGNPTAEILDSRKILIAQRKIVAVTTHTCVRNIRQSMRLRRRHLLPRTLISFD
jgi:hypothetical protein